MFINFDDIGQVCVTFRGDPNTTVGAPCGLSRERTVELAGEGESFIGKVVSIRKQIANVVVKGFVTLPYSGTAPGVGYVSLAGDGAGAITVCDDGRAYLVVDVDTVNKTATILL